MGAAEQTTRRQEAVDVQGFELYERLGEGTMGVVFRARHLFTDQIVALKVLYPILAGNLTYLQRFKAEAEAATHLNHPKLRLDRQFRPSLPVASRRLKWYRRQGESKPLRKRFPYHRCLPEEYW